MGGGSLAISLFSEKISKIVPIIKFFLKFLPQLCERFVCPPPKYFRLATALRERSFVDASAQFVFFVIYYQNVRPPETVTKFLFLTVFITTVMMFCF